MTMRIVNVEIIPVKPTDGLVGFASFLLDGTLFLSSVAVFKRKDGSGYRILYPTKKAGPNQHCIFHPTTEELSRDIEAAICAKAKLLFEE